MEVKSHTVYVCNTTKSRGKRTTTVYILNIENNPLRTKELYIKVKDVTGDDIAYGTFRSYLNTFKRERKIYKKMGQYGWSLNEMFKIRK